MIGNPRLSLSNADSECAAYRARNHQFFVLANDTNRGPLASEEITAAACALCGSSNSMPMKPLEHGDPAAAVDGCRKHASNVGQDVKVFIILVLAPFAFAKSLFRLDEFNAFDPLHHFIAKLVFNAQS
jgi:hypothetical protein